LPPGRARPAVAGRNLRWGRSRCAGGVSVAPGRISVAPVLFAMRRARLNQIVRHLAERLMWRSGWALVPSKDVNLVLNPTSDADVEIWDYPWVGFPDGEIEGSDLNNLWSLVCGSSDTPLWETWQPDALDDTDDLPLILRAPPVGSDHQGAEEKIASVRWNAVDAFAALSESRIAELAAAWQKLESATSSLGRWKPEEVRQAIRDLKFLARQTQKLRPAWSLLMVWFC
jgi:hypothetical protein